MGFGILTAGLTWILSTYPPLVRQRALARQACELVAHEAPDRDWLRTVTTGVMTSTVDIRQFSAVYYFHTSNEETAFSFQARGLLRLARQLQDKEGDAAVESARLERALTSYAAALAERYVAAEGGASTDRILELYRELWTPRSRLQHAR